MSKNITKDMTSGSPMRLILEFALPLLLGTLFHQVYNLVDTMIVGKTLGVDALAAVGATGSVMFLILGFCMGLCAGFALPIAREFGAKNYENLKKYAGNAITLAALTAIVMTSLTLCLCHHIILWMNTPSNIEDMSYQYLLIIFAGIPTSMAYNLLSGFLRSLGDSRRPLYFLIISSALNIVLDLVFILCFHMGVSGAATATVLSQLVSALLCLIYIRRRVELLHISGNDLKPETAYVKDLFAMGFPMGFQYSITAIGSVILQTAINGLGSVAVASVTAASKIDMFGQCPFGALGNAMATYAGQNVGAVKYDRVKKGLYNACLLGSVYSLLLLLIILPFGKAFFLLFMDASETVVISQGYQCIVTYVCFYVPLAILNIVRFTIQGMGYSGLAVFAGLAEMIARSLVALVFVPLYGFTAACFAGPLAWLFADAFLIPAFYYCLGKLKKAAGADSLYIVH